MSIDVKRDDFLRHLAKMPHEGLRHWSRITEGERLVVVTYMTLYYDVEFAQRFAKTARTGQRPDLSIYVTNDSALTPEKLQKSGYKLLRSQGSMTIWVNAAGRQVWLLPPPKALPPPTPPGPDQRLDSEPRPHPDVEEAKMYADEYKDEQDELLRRSRELARLKATLPAKEYAERRAQWIKDYEEWEDNLDEVKKNVIPGMTGQLTQEEQDAKQAQVKRLEDLHTTPIDFFPPSAE